MSDKDFIPTTSAVTSAKNRLEKYDWETLAGEMNSYGCAVLPESLPKRVCRPRRSLSKRGTFPQSHSYGSARLRQG